MYDSYIENNPSVMCNFKYVNDKGVFKNNKGDYLSIRYSILGSAFTWYTIDGTLYFRYSFADKIIKRYWIEFQWGTTNKRYTFRLKIKKNLITYEEL